MSEYEIRVTMVATVYVEANSKKQAEKLACEEALLVDPDEINCEIINIRSDID